MTDQTPLIRYIGDDWVAGPITLYGSGSLINLTGCTVTGLFFAQSVLAPVYTMTTLNGGIVLASDLTTGVITAIKIPKDITAAVTPQTRTAKTFPTRAAIVVTDSLGISRTYLLVLFLPLDRRVDVPPVVTLSE